MASTKKRRGTSGESKRSTTNKSKSKSKGRSKGKSQGKGRCSPNEHDCRPFLDDDPPDPPVSPGLQELLAILAQPDDKPQRQINKWTTEDDLDAGPWFVDDEHGNTIQTHEAARAVLARAAEAAGEVWLWCLHCQRFFQAKHLKLDFLGNWQRCPFDDCGAAGLDIDILHWDAYKDIDEGWPESEHQLVYGMRSDEARNAPN